MDLTELPAAELRAELKRRARLRRRATRAGDEGRLSIAELLCGAIRKSGMSRYAISKATGVDQGQLCNFLQGKAGLSFETADRILVALGLEIVIRRKRAGKGD